MWILAVMLVTFKNNSYSFILKELKWNMNWLFEGNGEKPIEDMVCTKSSFCLLHYK